MMQDPITEAELFIAAAAIVGATLGTVGTWLYYALRIRRIEKETWNTARIFYTRKEQELHQ